MKWSEEDRHFMRLALAEAQLAAEEDEVPVGAIVVAGGRIIARGRNMTERLADVTAHAEMLAITAAAQHLGAKFLNDCTLYVSLEMCLMCAGACYWSRLGRIVFAASDLKRGYRLCEGKILHPSTKCEYGLMEEESASLLSAYFQRKRH